MSKASFPGLFGADNACACGCNGIACEAVSDIDHSSPSLDRRRLLHMMAGVAALPLWTALSTRHAQAAGPIEKARLKIGYIPITCAVPLLIADAFGYYKAEGLDVTLDRIPSNPLIRDRLLNGELDGTLLVLPFPFAISLGMNSPPQPITAGPVLNIHGEGLVMHTKHRNNDDPKNWKGLRFGIPFEYSMQNLLLRYYLAEHGLDPDKDVELRVFPPPDSVANLRSGNLDGMIYAEPWCQRAIFEGVGYYHLMSKDIIPGHPCCSFGVKESFVAENPNTYAALFRAIAKAGEFAHKPENRKEIAEKLSGAAYLNQPQTLIEQVMVGTYADGKGAVKTDVERIDYVPSTNPTMSMWMVTQLRRWGYLKSDIDYRAFVERVLQLQKTDAELKAMGLPPSGDFKPITVMGKTFDPTRIDDYMASFAIRRA